MKVEIKQITPWIRALNAARLTIGKEPLPDDHNVSDKFKIYALLAEHSPIRLVEYDIIIDGLTNESMGHLVRHFLGVEKFVSTLRNDRTNVDGATVTYLTPRKIMLSANANALINISRRRLCHKAHPDTVKVWELVREEMRNVDSVMASVMVPHCVYRGFCPEQNGCKWINSAYGQMQLKQYQNLI